MKLWPFSLGILTGAALLIGVRYFTSTVPPHRDWLRTLAPRAPASMPDEICEHFYNAVCVKPGETNDPTGHVRSDTYGEFKALKIYEEILDSHPAWTREQVEDALVAEIYTSSRTNRVREAFRWTQKALIRLIEGQPSSIFSSREKRQIKKRVQNTQLELPPPVSIYGEEKSLFTKNDVFYERLANGKMHLHVGGAFLLSVKSWFNLIFTFAHELSHSIDPCEIRGAGLSFPAYDRLASCFLRTGLIQAHSHRKECVENDQLAETFADWLAVKVTSRALESFATEFHGPQVIDAATNAVRDLCEQDEAQWDLDLDLQYHPPPRVRIETIFGANPTIRDLLGCPISTQTPEYCEFE